MRTRIAVINLDWTQGNERAVLHRYAATHDILAIVEARTHDNRPLDVAAILGDRWTVLQCLDSAAESGSALAIRNDARIKVADWSIERMSKAGRDVQARYLLTAVLRFGWLPRWRRRRVLLVGHLPLPSTGRQRDSVGHIRGTLRWVRARRRRWMFLGDVNMTPDQFAAAIDAPHVYGHKPMAAAWSWGWRDVRTAADPPSPGTDHHVLKLRVR